MWYSYKQNNTYGTWASPAQVVFVEADTAAEADSIAEGVGVYFDGVADERDCQCCGNRWERAYWNEGTDVPTLYDYPLPDNGDSAGVVATPYTNYSYIKVTK